MKKMNKTLVVTIDEETLKKLNDLIDRDKKNYIENNKSSKIRQLINKESLIYNNDKY